MMVKGKHVPNISCHYCKYRHPAELSCAEARMHAALNKRQEETHTMSSINESNNERSAGKALAEACHRGCRKEVVNLLAKYGATRLRELRLNDLYAFARECEALQPPRDAVEMPVPSAVPAPKFTIGDKVIFTRFAFRNAAPAETYTVCGYELRYILKDSTGNIMGSHYGYHSERLCAAPPPPPAPPAAPVVAKFAVGDAVGSKQFGNSLGTVQSVSMKYTVSGSAYQWEESNLCADICF